METDIKFEEKSEDDTYNLMQIIMGNMDLIYYISEVEQTGLYDKFDEDKIKCFISAFKTIELAQKELQRKLRK